MMYEKGTGLINKFSIYVSLYKIKSSKTVNLKGVPISPENMR